MDILVNAIVLVFDAQVLIGILGGTILGLIMGSLPGLTAAMAIALLIPLTFGLTPIVGMGVLLGAFCGAIAGGAVPALLLNIPGTPSSVCTTLDGFPMVRNGRAGEALGLAVASSFLGGVLGALFLMLLAPPIASFALAFGPAEFFALGVFGIVIIASVSSGSILRGIAAGILGLGLSTVGSDPMTGVLRFTAGEAALITGIGLLPALIGLFAVSQVFKDFAERAGLPAAPQRGHQSASARVPWAALLRGWKVISVSTIIGVIVGAIPGAGGSISSFLSYDQAKRMSKTPEKFGTGHSEGVIASETANNATAGGALIPMLTLGVPGEVATAVLMGGLTIQGLRPGPGLFEQQTVLFYGILVAFLLANVVMFLTQLLGIRVFIRILQVPPRLLMPLILMFCAIGVYGVNGSIFELWLMLGFGILGFFLSRYEFGTAPVILGLILGGLMESNLRRGLLVFDGDWTQFVLRPIAAAILVLAALFLGTVIVQNRKSVPDTAVE